MADRLQRAYEELQSEAARLAGGLTDVAQRAAVYRHMYRFSGGNHVFPLIAAHGALWSSRYFGLARRLAELLSWQYAASPARRRQQLERLTDFEDALREINRRVCADTYVSLHLTARFGAGDELRRFVPATLLDAMATLHAARRSGQELPDDEKRRVFEDHFRNEQEHVVGPALTEAVQAFEWPLVRALAVRPPIRFAYFEGFQCLAFRNFADRQERIEKGLLAFRFAAQAGWWQVEAALDKYGLLPQACFAEPEAHFLALRAAVLATA